MIANAPTVRALVAAYGYSAISAPRAVAADSSRLVPVTGERWIAVGDAACTFDPLSSQGLLFAMTSGRRAAAAILAALAGDAGAIAAYAAETERIWSLYTRNRRLSYAQERRFADALYWRRRNADAEPSAFGITAPGVNPVQARFTPR
jgi:flavin-dependent dehydrogenase